MITALEIPMEAKIYLTPEGIYTYDGSMAGSWVKMPESELEKMQAMMNRQAADPAEQLEHIEAIPR